MRYLADEIDTGAPELPIYEGTFLEDATPGEDARVVVPEFSDHHAFEAAWSPVGRLNPRKGDPCVLAVLGDASWVLTWTPSEEQPTETPGGGSYEDRKVVHYYSALAEWIVPYTGSTPPSVQAVVGGRVVHAQTEPNTVAKNVRITFSKPVTGYAIVT